MSSLQYSGGGGFAPYGTTSWSPYTSPIPGASGYLQAQAMALEAYQKAKAQLETQRNSILRGAGYKSIAGGKIAVDPNNPVGGVQLLHHGFNQQNEQLRQNYLDRGVWGGLANQGMTEAKLQEGKQAADFGTQLTGQLGNVAGQEQAAQEQYTNTLWQSQQQAAQQAIANQEFNPALLPNEQTPPQPTTYGTQVQSTNVNMLNNPAFMDFIRKLLGTSGQKFIGNGINLLK